MMIEAELRSQLQNRVDPWGKFQCCTARGAWMGNRGILHDAQKQIVRPYQHSGWVTCLLSYGESTRKGKTARDKLFTPGNYSELFFLDEATALSAGHRPCYQCRSKRYKEFKSAWVAANRERLQLTSLDPSYQEMDKALQNERVQAGGEKRTFAALLSSLPNGTMIELNGQAALLWRGRLYRWSFDGYSVDKTKVSPETTVQVLTPTSIVRMYAAGFIPQVHVSAFW